MITEDKTIEYYERIINHQNKVIEVLTNLIKEPYIVIADDKGKIIQTIDKLEHFRRGL